MFKCKKCHGSDIRTRTNFSHGSKSRSTTTVRCRGCGSTDIETQKKDYKRRR